MTSAATKCRCASQRSILAQCSKRPDLHLCYTFLLTRSPAMIQHAKIESAVPTGISPEEWQARADLAAVYRLCAHYGWDDLIYNHCSMRVPGEPSKFLMKQHELLWTEVTASNLRKVDMNDD